MLVSKTVIQFIIVRFDGNTRVVFVGPKDTLADIRAAWNFHQLDKDKNCRVVRQHICGKTKHVFLEVTEFGFNLEK